ncbi:MAG: cell division protein FtsA [Candidatus Kapaibacterium sp.]|nr:MAG: cell division protein FtsA [Candidatus Kapabacteria bacterium]
MNGINTIVAAPALASKGRNFVVGLDIGTTKICAVVAEAHDEDGSMTVVGIGKAPSEGLNRGVVVNIEKTINAIREAIDQAQQQSGVAIEEAIVGIAGDHIQSFQTTGIVSISNSNREITQHDVNRLLDETRKIALPADRRILHIIPQDYIIDGQDGIKEPVGMSGIRMEARVHVVTGLVTAAQNIYRCVERVGLSVRDIVLEPIASSYSVLDDEEKEIGVALIDIGGGTTDIAIFEEGIIRHTAVFGIAGRQVTDDIRKGLGILAKEAERVKREYGHTFMRSLMQDEVFMIPGVGGRKPLEFTKSMLCQIVQPRMEELLEFAFAEIRRSGYIERLSAGVVLTGGGSLLRGTEELASEIFGLPIKIGIPVGCGSEGLAPEIENPQYATGIGLIRYGVRHGQYLTLNDLVSPDIEDNDMAVTQEQPFAQQDNFVSLESAQNGALYAPDAPSEASEPRINVLEKMKSFFQEL